MHVCVMQFGEFVDPTSVTKLCKLKYVHIITNVNRINFTTSNGYSLPHSPHFQHAPATGISRFQFAVNISVKNTFF